MARTPAVVPVRESTSGRLWLRFGNDLSVGAVDGYRGHPVHLARIEGRVVSQTRIDDVGQVDDDAVGVRAERDSIVGLQSDVVRPDEQTELVVVQVVSVIAVRVDRLADPVFHGLLQLPAPELALAIRSRQTGQRHRLCRRRFL